MNSDPFDSAAWRTFNMLDADEAAMFDEALRHDPVLRSAYLEMDRLSAAIATVITLPIEPKAGQLERLQKRLGITTSRTVRLWPAVTGWVLATVLAVLLMLHLTGIIDQWGNSSPTQRVPSELTPNANVAAPASNSNNNAGATGHSATVRYSSAVGKQPDGKATIKVETKRLNQEIEVLRDNLEKFQHRDRVLFEVVPGMALPIVMTMNPPGLAADDPAFFSRNDERSPITTLLGDALTAMTGVAAPAPENPAAEPGDNRVELPAHPTAIPIYDAARDSGTLVVSNLPPVDEGEVYNFWVITQTGGQPIYVGSLPENSATGADSFDFTLGSTMVLPSGFVLTLDPQDDPANPTADNIILQGPPTPR